jgi:aspartate aminotransferase-like enzyme
MPAGGWVWGAHHETSTGVLNNLPGLVTLAKKYKQRVCVDCVSSLATVPLDLSDIWLATGASGKAIGSYAGIAFVFADPATLVHIDSSKLPTYLDIAAALATEGPRFTVPSPLINALHTALEVFATPASRAARYRQIADVGAFVRERLEDAGFAPTAPTSISNPSIITFAPPDGESTAEFVDRCRGWGYQIAGQSGYLAERRLVQIAVMGAVTASDVEPLLNRLVRIAQHVS